MASKQCFKCGEVKDLSEYYKHKQMGDGHLNKCKTCTQKDTKERADKLLQNPDWVEAEQQRHREKYYRLGYKEKHKPTTQQKKEAMGRYLEKYPERKLATTAAQRIPNANGHNHHWSYKKEHWKDVIDISSKNHAKAHRFLVYDQEQMMYRRTDNNELLDTREKHEEWINWCIANKPD